MITLHNLAGTLSKQLKMSPEFLEETMLWMFSWVREALAEGYTVQLEGIGTLTTKEIGINLLKEKPQKGKTPEFERVRKQVVKFAPTSELEYKLNKLVAAAELAKFRTHTAIGIFEDVTGEFMKRLSKERQTAYLVHKNKVKPFYNTFTHLQKSAT